MASGELALVNDVVEEVDETAPVTLAPGSFIKVELCEMSDPNTVYVQDHGSAEELERLRYELYESFQANNGQGKPELKVHPEEKEIRAATKTYTEPADRPRIYVAAPYDQDGAYYRAQLRQRTSFTTVKVFFIDYGNTAEAALDDIYDLPVPLRKRPPVAIKVSLPTALPDTSAQSAAWMGRALEFPAMLHVQSLTKDGAFVNVVGDICVLHPDPRKPVQLHQHLQRQLEEATTHPSSRPASSAK